MLRALISLVLLVIGIAAAYLIATEVAHRRLVKRAKEIIGRSPDGPLPGKDNAPSAPLPTWLARQGSRVRGHGPHPAGQDLVVLLPPVSAAILGAKKMKAAG